ncbi:MAG: hypothetical protein [Cressdnaviricota sp.]|nr:MAG: hypothetical protein [Cressdnaviricota sp.]
MKLSSKICPALSRPRIPDEMGRSNAFFSIIRSSTRARRLTLVRAVPLPTNGARTRFTARGPFSSRDLGRNTGMLARKRRVRPWPHANGACPPSSRRKQMLRSIHYCKPVKKERS